MYYDYFSNFARRNCASFSDAVSVHRVVRAVEFKMATACKFLSLAASFFRPFSHFGIIFEQEDWKRENAGSLCIKHGTLSKVSHYITLHHIVLSL